MKLERWAQVHFVLEVDDEESAIDVEFALLNQMEGQVVVAWTEDGVDHEEVIGTIAVEGLLRTPPGHYTDNSASAALANEESSLAKSGFGPDSRSRRLDSRRLEAASLPYSPRDSSDPSR